MNQNTKMKYRQTPPESYADKLYWTEVTRVEPDGVLTDPNERVLFCSKCKEWKKHVHLAEGWMCLSGGCGEFIPETKIGSYQELEQYLERGL